MVKFDIKKIVSRLVDNLSDRSKDIILSRFGIGKDDYDTLEAIGQRYGITRERVRQIEADALKHIKSASNESVTRPVITVLNEFIKSNGGVMDENDLKASFASNHFETKPEPTNKYEG
ncbi:MAG: sigma factor-like helix-turn-helix DNA-binding protein, partial [bacterium]|nr:sigma factor-like helix-turn-helix DNA-binding protein [bacterium]